MATIQIKIPDQLMIPFGGPKWSIERISVIGVSTTGTYLQSDTPLAYIDRSKGRALRLRDFLSVVPGSWGDIPNSFDGANAIQEYLRDKCELATESERRFLELYFEYCQNCVTPPEYIQRYYSEKNNRPAPYNDDDWIFDALMPLPQAHLYQADPLENQYSFVPNRMMKVDFAMWTGKELIAIEIDGGSHVGSEAHVQKDRLLQRSGVHVIHILNSEINKHGIKVVERLLPTAVTQFWSSPDDNYRSNPFFEIPF